MAPNISWYNFAMSEIPMVGILSFRLNQCVSERPFKNVCASRAPVSQWLSIVERTLRGQSGVLFLARE